MKTPALLVNATINTPRRHPPFGEMDDAALRFLVEKAKLAYYAADPAIFSPQHGKPERFFIVKRGCVQNAVKSGGGGVPSGN